MGAKPLGGATDIPPVVQSSERKIKIQASCAGTVGGDYAKIEVDRLPVIMPTNEVNTYRGFQIVVINSETVEIEQTKTFDTYESSDGFEAFIKNT